MDADNRCPSPTTQKVNTLLAATRAELEQWERSSGGGVGKCMTPVQQQLLHRMQTEERRLHEKQRHQQHGSKGELDEQARQRAAYITDPAAPDSYTWVTVAPGAETTLRTAPAAGRSLPESAATAVAAASPTKMITEEWLESQKRVNSFATELAALAASVSHGGAADDVTDDMGYATVAPAAANHGGLWTDERAALMQHPALQQQEVDGHSQQLQQQQQQQPQQQQNAEASETEDEDGTAVPRIPFVTGPKLAETESGVAMLSYASRRCNTIGAVRDALCIGALVDVAPQPATPQHPEALPEGQQQGAKGATTGAWLCCAGTANVRTASEDDAGTSAGGAVAAAAARRWLALWLPG